ENAKHFPRERGIASAIPKLSFPQELFFLFTRERKGLGGNRRCLPFVLEKSPSGEKRKKRGEKNREKNIL
ncbi:MAG: hypothetical protein AB1485_08600, partial [Candidatus Thermoplasmatota archaeon]